jgi:signal transduction histidine kinase
MKNWFETRLWLVIRIASLLTGFAAAVSFMRINSRTYNSHLYALIGDLWRMGGSASLLLFFSCVALMAFSVLKTESTQKPFYRNADAALLVILTYGVVLLGFYFIRFYYGFMLIIYGVRLLFLSFAVYMVVMLLFIEILTRIRERQLINTLYWPRFFKRYPVKRLVGFLMALLLVGNIFLLFIYFPVAIFYRAALNVPIFLLSLYTLSALTYFCAFVLNLSTEYGRMNTEKIQAERFKAELITNVSHDIRTPLTSIINYVGLMKTLPIDNKDFDDYIGILENKSTRLKTLIHDLMEASKAGTGNLPVDLRETNLSEIVGQIAGEFDDFFAERGLTLVVRQPNEPVFIYADNRHLWRVLENLFTNAFKYAMPGTRVFTEIYPWNDKIMFVLRNTSHKPIEVNGGVLAEQFIRGDRARQTEGSGLGLYIAKNLTELIGGDFDIRVTGDLFEIQIMFMIDPEKAAHHLPLRRD